MVWGILSAPRIEFDAEKSFTLSSIQIVDNGKAFYPSLGGGVSIITKNGTVYHPWSAGVNFVKLSMNSGGNEVSSEWIMYKKNDFYYHLGVTYQFHPDKVNVNFRDLGKMNNDTLREEYAEVAAVYMDRCGSAVDPHIIAVPYLTTFNILLANDCFVSIYFDWNRTNASQLFPYNAVYSDNSVFFSQYALYNPLTNGKRNKLDETIILKYSRIIDEVFPDLDNPVSKYYKESSERIVFDDWSRFDNSISHITELNRAGVKNIWHIVHNWQNKGYDVALPDVMPANPEYGGNETLAKLSELNSSLGNLFSLHENNIDIYTQSGKFVKKHILLGTNSRYTFNWLHPITKDTSYLSKPSEFLNLMVPLSRSINETFHTTAAYHDVLTSYDPSRYVDYDHTAPNAGLLTEPYSVFRKAADTLRKIHNGPVSSEGLGHFLYVGYFDDVCAEIHTAKSLPSFYYGNTEKLGGFYKPLFVDFDLLKMKEKAAVHGVGYYERFFFNNNYWQYMGRSRDSALSYSATELAYGHCAFFSSHSYNFVEQGSIEYNYVYPVQLRYSNASVSSIMYNDNGKLINASDYIRKYPSTFDDYFSKDFMSQVYIEYNNGLVIFVNRNPYRKWIINGDFNKGYASFHAIVNKKDSLYAGSFSGKQIELPRLNGWFSFDSD